MSSTKNNRIKRLIERNKKKQLYKIGRTPQGQTYEWFANKIARMNERRSEETKRLETAIGKRFPNKETGGHYYETPGKKERMQKFAHKKDSRAKKATAKAEGKKQRGMKKGG